MNVVLYSSCRDWLHSRHPGWWSWYATLSEDDQDQWEYMKVLGVCTHGTKPKEKDIGSGSSKSPSASQTTGKQAHLEEPSVDGYIGLGHHLNPGWRVFASMTRILQWSSILSTSSSKRCRALKCQSHCPTAKAIMKAYAIMSKWSGQG
jgi:hypothetical protein